MAGQAGTGGEGGVCPECRLIQSHGDKGFFISQPKYHHPAMSLNSLTEIFVQ